MKTTADIIYLDHNATTPCDEEVIDGMIPFLKEHFANPSSPHAMGRVPYRAIGESRGLVAELLRCREEEVVFTSGATESNNAVLAGVFHPDCARRGVVVSAIEHKSVLEPLHRLSLRGLKSQIVGVSAEGLVEMGRLEEVVNERTALVSIQAVNNETGVVQDIEPIADLVHERGGLFHCDISQLIGKAAIPHWISKCDFLSISGHKFYGPKGSGVLRIGDGVPARSFRSLLSGGGQEGGRRAGTPNVASIVGLGIAAKLALRKVEHDSKHSRILQDQFESRFCELIPGARINSSKAKRVPGTSSVTPLAQLSSK